MLSSQLGELAGPLDEAGDLGPLAWVLDETRKSIQAATKALRRFAHDAESARGVDLASVDANPLRMARQQLHQVAGALDMVEQGEAAQMVRGMEAAAQRLVVRPDTCTEAVATTLEKCGYALIEFVESALSEHPRPALGLFPQFRQVQELAGADRVHPADLWRWNWRWLSPELPVPAEALEYSPAVRSRLDHSVLKIMKRADKRAAAALAVIGAGLAAGTRTPHEATFWTVATAFFEALASAQVPIDVYVKRATSRVLLQYTALSRGDAVISERLALDLLFFCAQAGPVTGTATPALAAVRATWGLDRHVPLVYEEPLFGLYDPAVLAQARRRIESVKENWSALAGGDLARLRPCVDQIGLVTESLDRLHEQSKPLAESLRQVAQQVQHSGQPPSPELAMEVATVVLFLEASFAEFRPRDATFAARTRELAERLDAVRQGGAVASLQPWMEDLYRRVSDRQTMGTVVGELRVTLGEAEQHLDQYFRHPDKRELLDPVPGLLAQMRGVLSVLGLDQAALAVQHMRERVEALAAPQVEWDESQRAHSFERLGNSLGALGFLVDTLSYQPVLARKLFSYDEQADEFRFVAGPVGRSGSGSSTHDELAPTGLMQAVVPAVELPATDAASQTPDQLEQLAAQAALAERPALAEAASRAAEAARQDEDAALTSALADLRSAAESGSIAAPPEDAAPMQATTAEDDDLQEIFLEEAREVIANGHAAIEALAHDAADLDQLTTLRRAFHTLKGSSRMVGLTEFGSAAWSLEQLLNAWLAEQKPADEALRGVAGDGLTALGRWADDIAAQRAEAWRAQPFEVLADGLRVHGQRLALASQAVEADALPAPAADVGSAEDFAEAVNVVEPVIPAAEQAVAEAVDAQPVDPAAAFDLPGLEVSEVVSLDAASLPPSMESRESAFLLPDEPLLLATPAETPVAMPLEAASPQAEWIDLEWQLLGSPAEPEASTVPEPQPVPDAVEPVAQDSDSRTPDWVGAATPLELPDLELPTGDGHPSAAEPALEAPAAAVEPAAGEDAVRVIGDLRISTPLYNVYLGEAEQWSSELLADLSGWASHPGTPMPERAIARAHSLAGSSATVGFIELSEMARAVEHALERLQGQATGTDEQAQVLCAAADDIRRVLHQFAAGVLKTPAVSLRTAVQALEPAEAAPIDATAVAVVEPAAHAWAADEAHRAEPRTLSHELDDVSDVHDAIDPDLFPIFEEEAEELLPRLGGALRQWVDQPQDHEARAQVLRVLHTLKGSARLAGASRLGELAHSTESTIEALGTEQLSSAELAPLLEDFDRIQADFQRLRSAVQTAPGVEAPDAQLAQPVAAPEPSEPRVAPATVSVERGEVAQPTAFSFAAARVSARQTVRVRAQLLDRLMAQAGEVMTSRTRLSTDVTQLRASLTELTGNVERLRAQLRDVELQAETQMQSRLAQSRDAQQSFDPLEFDRFTRMQELTRMMAESVNDVATVQRNLQRAIESSEDDLAAQARQSRELQRDLLRTRMVEFDGVAERLYRVVRQASKETDKQVRLDIVGGNIEVDRGILERMTPAFEHLLRNAVVHGIEAPAARMACGKDASGVITIEVQQAGNDVSIQFRDDGAGLDLPRIRERAVERGLVAAGQLLSDEQASELVFTPGFSTATEVTGLAGRGVGMDVVRMEVQALGGRIETQSGARQGTSFKLVLPLTTAVTHVVMIRVGTLVIGVPSSLVEVVRRSSRDELERAYAEGVVHDGEHTLPFFWAGALLQHSARSSEPVGRSTPVVLLRSAAQRVALHVDEVLGNQEVVVKALGPQLSRLPGLVAITALASGAVALIYNPVALVAVYGERVRALAAPPDAAPAASNADAAEAVPPQRALTGASEIPLVLVVDDSITVRRVTQRLLQREGYRVALAADGLQGLKALQQERPAVVLSDIEMPRMDGFDFLRNIRADEQLRDLPVVMITSRIAEKHREHARQLGANHYLGKPYSEEELLGLVRSYARAVATSESA